MKLEFSQQLFKKFSNTKFHGNPSSSSSSRDVPRGQTYVQSIRDMMKLRHFSQFCEHTKKMGEDEMPNPKQSHSLTPGLYYLCLHNFKKGKTIRMNVITSSIFSSTCMDTPQRGNIFLFHSITTCKVTVQKIHCKLSGM